MRGTPMDFFPYRRQQQKQQQQGHPLRSILTPRCFKGLYHTPYTSREKQEIGKNLGPTISHLIAKYIHISHGPSLRPSFHLYNGT